ncbi:MAG: hypothetical protein M3M83_02350 [Thermoproteota archaeon]|nr:hypothetical protein [Thermoproteota archaeon]
MFAFNNPFAVGLHRQYHTEENNMIQKIILKQQYNNNKRIIKPEWNDDGKGNLSSDK